MAVIRSGSSRSLENRNVAKALRVSVPSTVFVDVSDMLAVLVHHSAVIVDDNAIRGTKMTPGLDLMKRRPYAPA